VSAAAGPALGVGVACFSTFGGSGVIAAEIGMSLARRGHRVHVFSDDVPGRLDLGRAGVAFHRVDVRPYPQLRHSPYALALTSKIVEVSRRERLDVVHAHYAIPHAVSAYLARQLLGSEAPRIVTTLHGTDITLVGSDPSFLPLTRFSIVESDAVTTPSAWLAEATHRMLDVPAAVSIDVIPNFVDTDRFRPAAAGARALSGPAPTPAGPRVLVHVSNFRPLKRVDDVVRVFARVRAVLPARLRLVGDGPERPRALALARELGVAGDVELLGEGIDPPDVLRASDLFVLPSEMESFGLAALEAMACGVPVVASNVGGLPEVVTDGEAGFLCPPGDVAAMAAAACRLLTDDALHRRFAVAARRRAETCFPLEPAVTRYESLYRRVLSSSSSRPAPS
jgi:N-acetyl-alpha-D-glucosaminyl L-malate synthase BshA